jgi:hypothetical protein
MRFPRHLVAMLALLQATGLSAAAALEGEWVSYRDAYRKMVVFEKYGGAKNLIQSQVQVLPKEAGGEPLELALTGATTRLKLPLDATGRAVFPLLKAAYDENAVLAINRKDAQFALRQRISVIVRPDGVYDTMELRSACEQALGFARYVDASARGKQCIGVRFVFDKKAAVAPVRLRKADGATSVLAAAEGAAFGGENESFATVTYRFNGAERAQVLTAAAPLAIAPVIEELRE